MISAQAQRIFPSARRAAARWLVAASAFTVLSGTALAEPIRLKLAFVGSEQADTFRYGVKPFVDAINADGQQLLRIDVHSQGALGAGVADQPRLVLEGGADIAWVVPGQTPYRFRGNEVLELPALFADTRTATLVYTRLVATDVLDGYKNYFVIGAYMSAPTILNSRRPIGSLAALAGQRIRGNNATQAEALRRLGAQPTVMPSSQVAAAIKAGTIDGTAICPAGLFIYDVAPVVRHHYLLSIGASPSALVMSRKTFDRLPEAAQTLIRKHSGEVAAATWIELYDGTVARSIAMLKSDPVRTVVEPTASDRQATEQIYRTMTETWAAASATNAALLARVHAEIDRLYRKN